MSSVLRSSVLRSSTQFYAVQFYAVLRSSTQFYAVVKSVVKSVGSSVVKSVEGPKPSSSCSEHLHGRQLQSPALFWLRLQRDFQFL